MFGYTELDLTKFLNNDIRNILLPQDVDKFNQLFDISHNTKDTIQKEISFIKKNGVATPCLVRCFYLTNKEVNREAFYFLILDISEPIENQQKLIQKKIELEFASTHDALTSLNNRFEFIQQISFRLRENPELNYTLIRTNIHNFKYINENLGHNMGDEILIKLAQQINVNTSRNNGIAARLDSDHFGIFIETSKLSNYKLPSSILLTLSSNIDVKISLKYGIYNIIDSSIPIEVMIDYASFAGQSISTNNLLYINKYNEKLKKESIYVSLIEEEASKAIKEGQFKMFYQPVFNLDSKQIVSAEALLRWFHPQRGLIPPNKFIPLFEKNNFIVKIDRFVIEEVCKYIRSRLNRGLPSLPISINLSRISLYDNSIVSYIEEKTSEYNISPSLLHLELTESAYISDDKHIYEGLDLLRKKGFIILMDDFGSGYSSLNSLKDIPIDIIKIDMKFLHDFEKSKKGVSIIATIIKLAESLNLDTIAEGVETINQISALSSLRCANIQGYFFSLPLPEKEFEALSLDDKIALLDSKK